MKTIKHSLLFAATLITAATAFGQARLGVTGSARASVSKTVDASNTSARAAHAADRAATHTVAGSKHAARTTGTRAAAAGSAAGKKVYATGAATGQVIDAQKSGILSPDAKANADVKSAGHLHASDRGLEKSSETSILNRTETNASVKVGAQVEADGTKEIEKTNDGLDKPARIKARAESKAAKAARKAEDKKGRIKEEGRANSQASVNASENAKEHANEHSAVFGAKDEKSAGVRNAENGPSVESKTKSRAKVKAVKN